MEINGESGLRTWLEGLYELEGRLTPSIVLEASRPKNSPGHAHIFDMGTADAAERYYLDRAHKLIQRVKVNMITQADEPARRVRYFVGVPGGEDSNYEYVSLPDLARQPDKMKLAKAEAVRRLRAAESSLSDLEAVSDDSQVRVTSRRALSTLRGVRAEFDN